MNNNCLSLFSGIGGLDLAAQMAGFNTVAFCENNKFCIDILKKHWPKIPIYEDIRFLDYKKIPQIKLLYGGYPCQPFSVAGNRKGFNDERSLWQFMFRAIRKTNPEWVVCENVKGHITLGLDEVLSDLESENYSTTSFCIPAFAIGAKHIRERIFVVSHSSSNGQYKSKNTKWIDETNDNKQKRQKENSLLERCRSIRIRMERYSRENWGWRAEPNICRISNGVSRRLDRIKALGNAVMPYQAYPIFEIIKYLSE